MLRNIEFYISDKSKLNGVQKFLNEWNLKKKSEKNANQEGGEWKKWCGKFTEIHQK